MRELVLALSEPRARATGGCCSPRTAPGGCASWACSTRSTAGTARTSPGPTTSIAAATCATGSASARRSRELAQIAERGLITTAADYTAGGDDRALARVGAPTPARSVRCRTSATSAHRAAAAGSAAHLPSHTPKRRSSQLGRRRPRLRPITPMAGVVSAADSDTRVDRRRLAARLPALAPAGARRSAPAGRAGDRERLGDRRRRADPVVGRAARPPPPSQADDRERPRSQGRGRISTARRRSETPPASRSRSPAPARRT